MTADSVTAATVPIAQWSTAHVVGFWLVVVLVLVGIGCAAFGFPTKKP